jgi:hypothetical protein
MVNIGSFVWDARGLVDDEHVDVGEAADGVSGTGEADDAAVGGEEQLVGIALLQEGRFEESMEVDNDAEQLGGLAEAAREEKDQGAGFEESLVEAEDGDDGGFAGLARAIEQEAFVVAFEDLELPGVGLEAEDLHEAGGGWEGHGVGGVRVR